MVEAHYTCPDCGSIDLIIDKKEIVLKSGESTSTAECPNCCWKGGLVDTAGIATTEQLWTIERIGELMIRIISRHAAGPMVQAYEHVGLIPRMRTVPAEDTPELRLERAACDAVAQGIRDRVMRAICVAAIEAGFDEAARCHTVYTKAYGLEEHPVLQTETTDKVFGGPTETTDKVFGSEPPTKKRGRHRLRKKTKMKKTKGSVRNG